MPHRALLRPDGARYVVVIVDRKGRELCRSRPGTEAQAKNWRNTYRRTGAFYRS